MATAHPAPGDRAFAPSPRAHGVHALHPAAQGADTPILSGGETNVCVLATVMSAIDLGFDIVLATNALCSVSGTTHDALLLLDRARFSQQITTATTEEIVRAWN